MNVSHFMCKSCIFHVEGKCILTKMINGMISQSTKPFFCNLKWYFPNTPQDIEVSRQVVPSQPNDQNGPL